MSIFANKYVDIDIYFTVKVNSKKISVIKILEEKDALKMKADPQSKESVQCLKTKWIQQSWRANQDMVMKCYDYNHTTEKSTFNPLKLRDVRLNTCLVDWDAKTEDGEPIPCNEYNIGNLHIDIAAALVDSYEKFIASDDDELEKN
jgi:hypothetical protein